MPDFVPCRTEEDQDVHLYAHEDAARSLCGKTVGSPAPQPGNQPVCVDCARKLLKRIVRLGGSGGIAYVEVTVHPAGQAD